MTITYSEIQQKKKEINAKSTKDIAMKVTRPTKGVKTKTKDPR